MDNGPCYVLLGSSCGAYALVGADTVITIRELIHTWSHLKKTGSRVNKERLLRLSLKLLYRVLNCAGQVVAVLGASSVSTDVVAYSGHVGGLVFGAAAMAGSYIF
jgi:membrane associated rhomboid family serine protease